MVGNVLFEKVCAWNSTSCSENGIEIGWGIAEKIAKYTFCKQTNKQTS